MRSLLTLFAIHALACLPAFAQTKQVLKTISTNGITESLVVPSGKTLTIASGATLTAASGSTITGIGSGLTIGSSTITSGTSGRALYNNSGVLGEINLASLYQPLSSTLTTLSSATAAGLALMDDADAADQRTTLGLGTLATQSATITDYAPLASPTFTGTITTAGAFGIKTPEIFNASRTVGFNDGTVRWNNRGGSGFSITLDPSIPSANRVVSFNSNGALVSTADTGTVTSDMLAGSIALSKLAITGTADGTKFLRDDGSWQAVNLSAYLPLAGGTMTGPLVLPAGTAAAPSLTGSDTDSGIYFSTTNQIDFATGGTRKWYIDASGTLQGGSSSIQLSGNTLGTYFFARGGDYSIGASDDVTMSRDAAARMQMGRDHATVTTNQTIKAHDVTTGTGASLDLRGGNGSTAGGAVTISTSATTTPTVRMTVKASGVINMSGMPTSSAGLSSGDLWNNSGVINIVP